MLALALALLSALPLGTASIASSGGTCGGSLTTSSCRLATITCPSIADITASLKVTEPSGSATCTLVTFLGGGSSAIYETTTYGGANFLTPALTAGCRIVQVAFASGAGGQGAWEGPGRPTQLACRYATLLDAIHADTSLYPADKSIPFVAHGQSGGSSGVAYALGWYGLGSEIDCATLSGGPPIGALHAGCMGEADRDYGWRCTNYRTMSSGSCGFTNSAVSGQFIDNMFGDGRTSCALHAGGGAIDWRRESLIGTPSETAFPQTKIASLHGASDSSEAVPLGRYVLSKWTSLGLPIRWGSPASSTGHTVADTSVGATDIYTATFGGIGSDGAAYGKCYPFHAASPAADYWVTKRRVISWGGENQASEYAHSESALQLPNGTLLATLARGPGHGQPGTKVVLRTSTDDGNTWGLTTLDETTLASHADTTHFLMTVPVITRLSSGRVVVTFIQQDNTTPTPTYPERQPGVVYSDDDGATWSAPALVTGLSGTQFAVITGKLQEIGGNLCTTYYWRDLTENRYTSSWACTTEAALTTWTHQTNIARAASPSGIQYEEPQVTRLADGRLLALIRDDGTTASGETAAGQIWQAYSSDDGATWGSVTAAFPGIGWPSLVVASNGDVIAFTRKPSSGLSTRYSVYRVSTDAGSSWSAEHILGDWSRELSTYEYAGPFLRSDGTIGVAFAEDWYAARDQRTRNEYVEITRATGWRGWSSQTASINFPTLSAGSTLEALYDADPFLFDRATPMLNTTSGSALDVWPDLSGNGRDLRDDRTSGSQAVNRFWFSYGSGATHGVRPPGIVLRNSTSRMRTATWSPTISQPFAVLMSFATSDSADLNILGLDEAQTARLGRDGFARLFLRNTANTRWRTNTVTVPGRYVFAVLVNGASSVLRVNGADSMLAGDGTAYGSTTLTRLTLDASSTGSAQMTRSIVVLSNANAASLRTDFDTVEAWMLARERPTE